MKKINNFWIGRVEASIGLLIEDLPELLIHYQYVLISCIDSSRNLRTLKSLAQAINGLTDLQFVNGALLMKINDFLKIANTYNLFNGFDEIWLFSSSPLNNLPHEIWITGPLDISKEIPNDLIQWMMNSGCGLGLGDGIGLNFISSDTTIVNILDTKYGKESKPM
jgi:hypothetical protein